MNVEGFAHAERLFREALALTPHQRHEFIDARCCGDTTLAAMFVA